uniref:Tail protein n=1 Tax=viral metagenome TaxID=1070528 RepID=A0A6C0K5V4_9ZZZZ
MSLDVIRISNVKAPNPYQITKYSTYQSSKYTQNTYDISAYNKVSIITKASVISVTILEVTEATADSLVMVVAITIPAINNGNSIFAMGNYISSTGTLSFSKINYTGTLTWSSVTSVSLLLFTEDGISLYSSALTKVGGSSVNVTYSNNAVVDVLGDTTIVGNLNVTGNIQGASLNATSMVVTDTASVGTLNVTSGGATVQGNLNVTGSITGASLNATSMVVTDTVSIGTLSVTNSLTLNAPITSNNTTAPSSNQLGYIVSTSNSTEIVWGTSPYTTNNASLEIPAGTWIVWGQVFTGNSAGTTTGGIRIGFDITANTISSTLPYTYVANSPFEISFGNGYTYVSPQMIQYLQFTTATTIYLNTTVGYSGGTNPEYKGARISAMRVA